MAAVLAEQGPISIAVDASQTWHKYQQGILTNCTLGKKPRLDHGVLLVGLGSEDGQRYWTVKKSAAANPSPFVRMLAWLTACRGALLCSSWGVGWGEKGYLRIARGSNQCGLTSQPVIPQVDVSTPLPAPTPPLPAPAPSPGCPDGYVCYQPGEESSFYQAYKNSSCGDKLALIGTPERSAMLNASFSKHCPEHGPCRTVPLDLSQQAGTELVMQDVVISGAHRMWVTEANFTRVTFRDSSGQLSPCRPAAQPW